MKMANLIPISALDENRPLNQDKAQPIWAKPSLVKDNENRMTCLQRFDIIITNRNEPRIVLLSELAETPQEPNGVPNIASAPLMIVRLRELLKGRPQYLAWWLGHPKTRRTLRRLMKGTTVKVLSRAELENLDVPIPPPDNRLQGTTIEGLISDYDKKSKELRNKMNNQAKVDYDYIQEKLHLMAIGKIPVIK
jgi:hypothetical protein